MRCDMRSHSGYQCFHVALRLENSNCPALTSPATVCGGHLLTALCSGHLPSISAVQMAPPSAASSVAALKRCLPPGCSVVLKEEIQGDPAAGLEQVREELLRALSSLDESCNTLILDASTTTGKSKVYPSLVASLGKTLLATTVRVDVQDIAEKATVPAYWQVGGGRCGGCKRSSRLHVVTVGLLAKWVAEDPRVLLQYEHVILDEYDGAAADVTYSTLVERVRKTCKKCTLMSATHAPAADAMVRKGEAKLFQYHRRKHALTKFEMTCPGGQEEACTAALAKNLLDAGYTSLLFVPGEKEITTACAAIGPDACPLHAKAEEKHIEDAFRPRNTARVVCSSSIAEKGATIPDVTFVVDLGRSRKDTSTMGVSESVDYASDDNTSHQRASRAGRTHPGVAVRVSGASEAGDGARWRACGADDVMSAVLLGFSPALLATDTFLAKDSVPDNVVTEAFCELRQYEDKDQAMYAFRTLPVPLRQGPAVMEAARWRVQAETAWVLMLVEGAAVKKRLDVDVALRAMWSLLSREEEALHFHPRKLDEVRHLHQLYVRENHIAYSNMSFSYVQEAIAASLATLNTALCRVRGNCGYCVGVEFETELEEGHCVALGLRKLGRGRLILPTIELQMTRWATDQLKLPLPSQSAVVSSDSSLQNFRLDACVALRAEGLDLIDWRATGGAAEQEAAEALASCRRSEYALLAGNGNRTEKQERPSEPAWMKPVALSCARHLARFDFASAFLGDAGMSPGVRHPEAYAALVPLLQQHMKDAGVPLVTTTPMSLAADGVHWSVDAGRQVQKLIQTMVAAAKKVEAAPLPWFHYVRNPSNDIHYATCRACCRTVCQEHVASRKHVALNGSTGLPTGPLELFFGDSQLPRCLEPEEANVLATETKAAAQHKTDKTETKGAEYKTETKAAQEEAPPAGEALPDGWCCALAPCGNTYYWHRALRQTTWERPCPPPAVAPPPALPTSPLPPQKEERRCAACCAAKPREEFGREQFKKAWYGLGKCLVCAENQRMEAYMASMR